ALSAPVALRPDLHPFAEADRLLLPEHSAGLVELSLDGGKFPPCLLEAVHAVRLRRLPGRAPPEHVETRRAVAALERVERGRLAGRAALAVRDTNGCFETAGHFEPLSF